MKRRSRWIDMASSAAVVGVAMPTAYLPLWISYPLGEVLGHLAFIVDRRHRKVATENLRLAFGSSRTPDEIRAMARSHFRSLGQTFVDVCRLVRLRPEDLRDMIDVEGSEVLADPKDRGQGILYVTGHFGPWEYLPAVATHLTDEPLTVVARPLDNPYLDHLLNALRRRWGSRTVEKREAMSVLIDVLRQGGEVGVLIDQHVSRREGIFVNFFGYPACTTTGPALLALRSGAAVIPVGVVRVGRGRFRILLGKEVAAPRTGKVKEDVVALTAAMTEALEQLVRRRPEQWFWVHRRWKYRGTERDQPAALRHKR
ncbi:MAG: lysophospholipid acyltransferase family protein [Candidatus Methylomirabilales bacterium]